MKSKPNKLKTAQARSQQRMARPRLCDLLKTIKDHPWNRICKTCGKDCSRVAITKLVYAYEGCGCAAANYRHLVENIYHAECYAKRPSDKVSHDAPPK